MAFTAHIPLTAFLLRMELQIDDVSKTYGDGTEAVRDVSLTVSEGLIGLLGPNGAGKSTLMRLIATITVPTAGTLRWNGTDIVDRPVVMRRALGYLPQDFGVYPELSAEEFLGYMAALKGVPGGAARSRIDRLLEITGLQDARGRLLGGFSGGMIQRVGIACTLLNDPDLLVADEPTVGLDPEERARFRALLTDLADDRVVLLSTHIVSDVEATASRLAIMNNGRLATTAPSGRRSSTECNRCGGRRMCCSHPATPPFRDRQLGQVKAGVAIRVFGANFTDGSTLPIKCIYSICSSKLNLETSLLLGPRTRGVTDSRKAFSSTPTR
jgi:ABC-2 type transport system ATP-binding protein